MNKFGLILEKMKLNDEGLVTLQLYRKAGVVHLIGEFPSIELAESFFELLHELFELG